MKSIENEPFNSSGIELRTPWGISNKKNVKDIAINRGCLIDNVMASNGVPVRLTMDYIGPSTKGTDLAERVISHGKPIQFHPGEVKIEVPHMSNESIRSIKANKRKALRKYLKANPQNINLTRETAEFMYGTKSPLLKKYKPESNLDIPNLSTYVSDTNIPTYEDIVRKDLRKNRSGVVPSFQYLGNRNLAPNVVRE